jgi:hypothetical protein
MNFDTKVRFFGLMGLGAIAVWLTLSLGNCVYLGLTSQRWPIVPVQVISSGVDTGVSTMGKWWAPEVEYQYQVDGRVYRSTGIRSEVPLFLHEEEARAVQNAYSRETRTSAAYDPRNPAHSLLEPGLPSGMLERSLAPLFFWGLTAYIFYEIKHPKRRFLLRSNPEEAG